MKWNVLVIVAFGITAINFFSTFIWLRKDHYHQNRSVSPGRSAVMAYASRWPTNELVSNTSGRRINPRSSNDRLTSFTCMSSIEAQRLGNCDYYPNWLRFMWTSVCNSISYIYVRYRYSGPYLSKGCLTTVKSSEHFVRECESCLVLAGKRALMLL